MFRKFALLKVMHEVLCNSTSVYSVHDAANKSHVSVFAAKHALDYLYEKKMLTLSKVGSTYQYKANLDNFLTRQWKVTFNVEEIAKAKIVERILETKKSIISVMLYGSCAVGRDDENSDIDVLVIADTDNIGKRLIASKSSDMRREINISVYMPSEWKRKAQDDKIFYEKIIIDSVSLFGQKPVVL